MEIPHSPRADSAVIFPLITDSAIGAFFVCCLYHCHINVLDITYHWTPDLPICAFLPGNHLITALSHCTSLYDFFFFFFIAAASSRQAGRKAEM